MRAHGHGQAGQPGWQVEGEGGLISSELGLCFRSVIRTMLGAPMGRGFTLEGDF